MQADKKRVPRDHENESRGLLRSFGLKVGRVSARGFDARVRDLVDGHPRLTLCIGALPDGRAAIMARMTVLHRALLKVTANDELCRRFMTIPGVGPVTALASRTAIDDPARFRRSSDVGAHLGLHDSINPERPTCEVASAARGMRSRGRHCSPRRI